MGGGGVIDVTLTPAELSVAALVGVQRQIQVLANGARLVAGQTWEDHWTRGVEGAAGEMAAAKALDRYWDCPIGTFRCGGDIGALQVRTRSQHDWDLIVRPQDRPGDVFVLVTGCAPRYRVHGWITGADAMRPEWLREHGGRPAAYFVPRTALAPLETLPRKAVAA